MDTGYTIVECKAPGYVLHLEDRHNCEVIEDAIVLRPVPVLVRRAGRNTQPFAARGTLLPGGEFMVRIHTDDGLELHSQDYQQLLQDIREYAWV